MPSNIYMVPRNGELTPLPQFCANCGYSRHDLNKMLTEPRELVNGVLQDTKNRLLAIKEIKKCPNCLRAFKEVFQILGISNPGSDLN